MAKLVRVEFIRRENDEWMVFEKFENGDEQGSRTSEADIRAIVDKMFDTKLGGAKMPTDLAKEDDERPDAS